ncbi:MAG: SDR family oxidoreductase [Candidatus Sericytochromatia bacterium]|nr:SDR family oxidoreductase [Candidatus Sericytochromatia bacterium]
MQQHILITGGCGGLGRAVVKAFAQAGHSVTVVDAHPPSESLAAEWSAAGDIRFQALNILDRQAVQQLAEATPKLDVLINLIGGFAMGPLESISAEDLNHQLNLNLHSTFNMSQAFLPQLKAADAGRIVNVGARQALLGGPGVTAYALSKAAVVNFTQSLAQEVKDTALTVNAVVPSTIDTPANRSSMPDADFDKWVRPEDLAAVIGFLASPAARAVSGAIIPVYHKA